MTYIHGTAISLNTQIKDLPLNTNNLLGLIVIEQVDGDILRNALEEMDISTSGELDGANKKIKLAHTLDHDDCLVNDVVKLHKNEFKTGFKAMFVSHLTNICRMTKSSTPIRGGGAAAGASDDATLNMLTLNVQMMSKVLSNFPQELAKAMANCDENKGYATHPTTPTPTYNIISSDIALTRFIDTK